MDFYWSYMLAPGPQVCQLSCSDACKVCQNDTCYGKLNLMFNHDSHILQLWTSFVWDKFVFFLVLVVMHAFFFSYLYFSIDFNFYLIVYLCFPVIIPPLSNALGDPQSSSCKALLVPNLSNFLNRHLSI